MTTSQKPGVGKPTIWALVALPPPVTGMTLLSEKIVERLRRTESIRCFDWSPKTVPRGWRFRVVRAWRVIQSLGMMLGAGRVRNSRLYVAANYRSGLWLTMILTMFGRCLGYQVYLHHHTYWYIDRLDRRMSWICSWLGAHGVHVVACPQMEQDFRRMYPTAVRFAHVSPSLVGGPIGSPRTAANEDFRLGYLGNLSLAKGLDLVLATFQLLRNQGIPVRLDLAGPCYARDARRLIDRALAEYPADVRWVGPVLGQVKWDFLAHIDCFLFPTRSESWGIVLGEALGVGIPAITLDRGCIRAVIGDRAGIVVNREDNYVSRAAEQVQRWRVHPEEYHAASKAAREQAIRLQREADQVLEEFVEQLVGQPPEASACAAAIAGMSNSCTIDDCATNEP